MIDTKLELDVWYAFKDNKDISVFLTLYNKMFPYKYNKLEFEDFPNCEALYINKNTHDLNCIGYIDERFVDVVWFKASDYLSCLSYKDFLNTFAKAYLDEHGITKEYIEGETTMNVKELIANRFNEKSSALTNKYVAEMKNAIENSVNGRLLHDTMTQVNSNLNALNTPNEVKYAFDCNILTPSELVEFNNLKTKLREELAKLDAKQKELIVLFDLADTFEQKQELLKKYGVLSE